MATNGDADISNPSIDAPDVHVGESQAVDQSPDFVEDDNNDNAAIVEDDNTGNNGDMLLAPMISPQFDSTNPYKGLGVPMNATEWQIKSLYLTLAKLRYPDHLPNHLNKDDGNRIFAAIGNTYKILGDPENRIKHDSRLGLILMLLLTTKPIIYIYFFHSLNVL